jgi:REP element-mobilizing transposase RayT
VFTNNLTSRGYLPHFDPTGFVHSVRISEHDVVPPNLRSADTINPYGACHLGISEIAENLVQSLKHHDRKDEIDLFAYVVMPNHVHLLARFHRPIGDVVRNVKSYTGRLNNLILGRIGCSFWQHDYYDQLVSTQEQFNMARSYIELNPVRAGLCRFEHEWPHSSAFGRRESVILATNM